jgi:antitoxin HicB
MYYATKITQSGDWWEVSFPDRLGIDFCGESLDDALEMASDALNSMLEFDLEKQHPLLEPRTKANPKKSLYAIEVEPRLEVSYRLLNSSHGNPTLRTLEKIANALGRRLEVRFA